MRDDVELLELESANATFDLLFWESLVEELRPKRVLELACGTGRVTLPLALKGAGLRRDFQIIGLDINEAFLDRAQSKAAALPPNAARGLRFIQGDMRTFEFGEPFDLILIPFNSFALLLETEEQLSSLAAIKRHLSPDGQLAIDIVAPAPFYEVFAAARKPLPALRVMNEWHGAMENVEWFTQQCFDRYDPVKQVVRRVIYSQAHYVGRRTKDLPPRCALSGVFSTRIGCSAATRRSRSSKEVRGLRTRRVW